MFDSLGDSVLGCVDVMQSLGAMLSALLDHLSFQTGQSVALVAHTFLRAEDVLQIMRTGDFLLQRDGVDSRV